jgi:superoxide dismutase, Fe-Mn family
MFTLPQIDYTLFEPIISASTMQYHHGKHHQTYLDNLNKLLETNPELQGFDTLDEIIISNHDLALADKTAITNNAGQVFNHNLYWDSMVSEADSASQLSGLQEQITSRLQPFGGLDGFKAEWKKAGLSQFGSGWVWLVLDQNNKLQIIKTANAETPLTLGYLPIITMDVWEHAYYLDYQNKRADYIDQYFKLINWNNVVYIKSNIAYNLRKDKISNFSE